MDKKAQNEIAGFIVIVVLVTIIGLIFLVLMMRPVSKGSESAEISNLLQSVMYHTSDCAVSYVPQYEDEQELIKSCYKNERCLDGRGVCEVLNQTLKEILKASLNVHEDSPNKAYRLGIYSKVQEEESYEGDVILEMQEGIFSNCTSRPTGTHSISVSSISSEKIIINLEVCKQ
jgi:hypothetical protein